MATIRRARLFLIICLATLIWTGRPLHAAATDSGWTPGTAGLVRGEVVMSPTDDSPNRAKVYCDAVCSDSEDCATECEYPVGEIWAQTTCAEYDGGWENGWCDVSTWDSCIYECPYQETSGHACLLGGNETDCDTFGDYATCGDDYCALDAGEDESSCSLDCFVNTMPVVADEYDSTTINAYLDVADDIDSALPGGVNSVEDISVLAGILYEDGMIDEDYSGFFEEDESPEQNEQDMLRICETALKEGDEELAENFCSSSMAGCVTGAVKKATGLSAIFAVGAGIWGVASGIIAVANPPAAAVIFGVATVWGWTSSFLAGWAGTKVVDCLLLPK